MQCVVSNCKSNKKQRKSNLKSNIKFFRFPKDDTVLLQKWIAFCGVKSEIDLDNDIICSLHFKQTDFERDLPYEMGYVKRHRPRLVPNAVPVIRPKSTDCSENATPVTKNTVYSKRLEITNDNVVYHVEPVNGGLISHTLDNTLKVVKDEIEMETDTQTFPLVLDIKIEPERISEVYEQTADDVFEIKDESENTFVANENKIQGKKFLESKETSSLHDLRKEIAAIKKENLILRKAAKKHVWELANLNKSLKKSEYQKLTMEKNLRLMFTEAQIKKLKFGTEKRLLWHEEDMRRAAELYSISTKAYELLQKNNFPLPSIRTTQSWMKKTKVNLTDPPKQETSNESVLGI